MESAIFNGHQLGDALLVAAALKLGVEEDIHQLAGKAGAHYTAAHAQGVGVVVAAGVLSAEAVGAAAGTDALDLVCGHADAHTGAAAPVDIEGNAIDLIPLSIASFIELK